MSLIIIGKKGFIAENLRNYFKKKKINFLNFSLDNFLKLSEKKISRFNNVINCSINKEIIDNKYKNYNDFDIQICKKIQDLDIRFIFLSTRKVYGRNKYANEKSNLYPGCNYSKNKLISEIKCSKILNNKLLILRISNLIGFRRKNKKRLHKTFIDHFLMSLNKGRIKFNFLDYKDFLSIDKFCYIIHKLCIKRKLFGIFNISMGNKIHLIDLINSLIMFSSKKIKLIDTKKLKSDNFVLNNKKLLKEIKVNIKPKNLFIYCNNLGRKFK